MQDQNTRSDGKLLDVNKKSLLVKENSLKEIQRKKRVYGKYTAKYLKGFF